METGGIKQQALVLARDTKETGTREAHTKGEIDKVHELLASQQKRIEDALGLLGQASTIADQVLLVTSDAQQTQAAVAGESATVVEELEGHYQRSVRILEGTGSPIATEAQDHLRQAHAIAFDSSSQLANMEEGFNVLVAQVERAIAAIPITIQQLGHVATRLQAMDSSIIEQGERIEKSRGHANQAAKNLEQYGGAI